MAEHNHWDHKDGFLYQLFDKKQQVVLDTVL